MSKIGSINLELQEHLEFMSIDKTVPELTDDERTAVKNNLETTIRTNSCEADCSHRLMLGLL